jgi:hypothetical protein
MTSNGRSRSLAGATTRRLVRKLSQRAAGCCVDAVLPPRASHLGLYVRLPPLLRKSFLDLCRRMRATTSGSSSLEGSGNSPSRNSGPCVRGKQIVTMNGLFVRGPLLHISTTTKRLPAKAAHSVSEPPPFRGAERGLLATSEPRPAAIRGKGRPFTWQPVRLDHADQRARLIDVDVEPGNAEDAGGVRCAASARTDVGFAARWDVAPLTF